MGLEQLEILSGKRVKIFILVQAMSGDRYGMGLKFWGGIFESGRSFNVLHDSDML